MAPAPDADALPTPARQRWAMAGHSVLELVRSKSLPACECSLSLADLPELAPALQRQISIPDFIARATSHSLASPFNPAQPFWPAAVTALILGVSCVVPYSFLLKWDPGCPLTFSFILHIAIIATYFPRSWKLLRRRRIPLKYHAAMVFFGCAFTTFKSDAFTRMPTSVCMLLFNMQMVVGVLVQFVVFKKRYSSSQICGVAIISSGIAWASYTQPSRSHGASGIGHADDFAIGVVEIMAASVSLTMLNAFVKTAFSRFGECVDEQVFIQHFCSLLLVFPSQWGKIGPRLADWICRGDVLLIATVLGCAMVNVAARGATVQMAGRAPNVLMTELVHTLEHFLQLLVASLLRIPPWPPAGFWGGALLLALGTLHYLRASDAPKVHQVHRK